MRLMWSTEQPSLKSVLLQDFFITEVNTFLFLFKLV